jgi:Na+/proline symporter
MADENPSAELDPRKVRIGLVMIVAVVVIALGLAAVIDSDLGRAIMIGIAVLGVIRAWLLYRSLQRRGLAGGG